MCSEKKYSVKTRLGASHQLQYAINAAVVGHESILYVVGATTIPTREFFFFLQYSVTECVRYQLRNSSGRRRRVNLAYSALAIIIDDIVIVVKTAFFFFFYYCYHYLFSTALIVRSRIFL